MLYVRHLKECDELYQRMCSEIEQFRTFVFVVHQAQQQEQYLISQHQCKVTHIQSVIKVLKDEVLQLKKLVLSMKHEMSIELNALYKAFQESIVSELERNRVQSELAHTNTVNAMWKRNAQLEHQLKAEKEKISSMKEKYESQIHQYKNESDIKTKQWKEKMSKRVVDHAQEIEEYKKRLLEKNEKKKISNHTAQQDQNRIAELRAQTAAQQLLLQTQGRQLQQLNEVNQELRATVLLWKKMHKQ